MTRIAIILPGGAKPYGEGVHIPSIYQLIERVSAHFDITVYSLRTLETKYSDGVCGSAKVKIVRASYKDHWLKKIYHYLHAVRKDHQQQPFEAIHGLLGLTAGCVAVVLGKFFRVPSIVSFRGGETVGIPSAHYGALLSPFKKFFMKWAARHASHLVLQTKYQLGQLQALRVERNDTHIIPSGVDGAAFYPNGRRKNVAPPYRLLHVANMHPVKDQTTLLKAFARICESVDCSLRVIGHDDSNGEIQKLAHSLGIAEKVEFLESVNYQLLPNEYRQADVLLHTSLHESQGIVIAEAAACGTVVCGTRVGLVHDFEPDKALAVAPADYEGLAISVLTLLKDATKRSEIQRAARTWAEQFDINWTASQYKLLYNLCAQSR